jgi:hypothetical protein
MNEEMNVQTSRTATNWCVLACASLLALSACSEAEEPTAVNACRVNSDCVGSQVDLDTRQIRCSGKELYCLEGTCVSTCQPECQVVRADVDPCESPAICAPRYVDVHLCTMKPVPCETKQDCPLFNPPYPDGGETSWSCEDAICRHPVVTYPTE